MALLMPLYLELHATTPQFKSPLLPCESGDLNLVGAGRLIVNLVATREVDHEANTRRVGVQHEDDDRDR